MLGGKAHEFTGLPKIDSFYLVGCVYADGFMSCITKNPLLSLGVQNA
jgi:hypothetical protein